MDLENTWQQGSDDSDEMLKNLLQKYPGNLQSKLPLKKLKNNLLHGIIWAILITVAYFILLLFVSAWQIIAAFCIMIIFNLILIAQSIKFYYATDANISISLSLKKELEKNFNGFQCWWKIQLRLSLFVFPIAATGGFILGGILGSGRPVEDFLYNATMLCILGITLLLILPLCYYLAKWMHKVTYGKHLEKLKMMIEELS